MLTYYQNFAFSANDLLRNQAIQIISLRSLSFWLLILLQKVRFTNIFKETFAM